MLRNDRAGLESPAAQPRQDAVQPAQAGVAAEEAALHVGILRVNGDAAAA